jgi:hypothetical protein
MSLSRTNDDIIFNYDYLNIANYSQPGDTKWKII